MPQISVMVPVYNAEPYLRRCLDSILAQTYRDFDLFLVDDGSTDASPSICDEYAAKDSRVRVTHQRNQGVSAARNTLLDLVFAESDSEWLCFVDSDDRIHPMYLEALMRAITDTGLEMAISGFAYTDETDPAVDVNDLAGKRCGTESYYRTDNVSAIVPWGKICRKECYRDIRYPAGKIHEDVYITHRILFRYREFALVSQPLYSYYRHPESITGGEWNLKDLDGLDAYKAEVDFLRGTDMHETYVWAVWQYLYFLAEAASHTEDPKIRKQRPGVHRKTVRRLKKELWAYYKELPGISSLGLGTAVKYFPPFLFLFLTAKSFYRRVRRKLRKIFGLPPKEEVRK